MMVRMILVLLLARCVCCGWPSSEDVVMERGDSTRNWLSETATFHLVKLRGGHYSFAFPHRISAEARAQQSPCQQRQQKEPHLGEEDGVVDAAEHPHGAHVKTPSPHNREPHHACKSSGSGKEEDDKELNTEKRLVPAGPNPLHN